MVLNKNEFGGLIKAYRKQRGWTQDELAERWGHSRSYVSQVESGRRTLDRTSQLSRLADILNIPEDKLERIGRFIPTRATRQPNPQVNDSVIQMLLEPGRDMVKLSWVVWVGDQHPVIEANLRNLAFNLERSLNAYNGEFRASAKQLLTYTHQMLGKIAFDRLDFASAGGHFSEMIEMGQELDDADIICVGMIQQGSLLRKRGRYDQSVRCFEAAKPFADVASPNIQGMRYNQMARLYSDFGDEQNFLRAINPALDIASHMEDSIDSLANEFSLDTTLVEQASGYSELKKPEESLKIYKETDKLRPWRPLREQGSYTITKAQALLNAFDLEKGIELGLRGIKLASQYRSKRQILWLDKTYNQLRLLPIGEDKHLNTLRDALEQSKKEQAFW